MEAKKPSVNLKYDISAAYQVRRYAWSAKLPLSILTDFEEFAVYDCRIRPGKNDPASTGRIMYITYQEYAQRWAEIASRFSKDAILRGAFDRFAESTTGKRGTSEVDNAFLADIESWRDVLARHLALRNQLSQRELNFAVQRTIDRIIFLRICEDRGIENYGQLQGLTNGPSTYRRLCGIFDRADDRYNSGLFHFQSEKGRSEVPDELSKKLIIDDKVLKDIFKGLYYPDSPYEFSVLPADILGQVYEQFLGKVIRLTAGGQAKVEEKPEVKKAGGVYYTPTYIVDYIVEHTVGRLLEGKTPKKAAQLRFLDPACGSGSFLIGVYQYLLDWHLHYYLDNGAQRYAKGRNPVLMQTQGGWKLTASARKQILLNNIYGVDIDSQAVEVTKLSLLLKALEGETEESINSQMQMFQERVLPDLGENIKCGNSLIGPDYYALRQQELDIFDEEEMYRINVFDWNSDTTGFGKIIKSGGFDAVVGNPPYVRQESLGADFKNYVKQHYQVYAGTADLYAYFFEKSHTLLREGGHFGMICSNKFMRANYGKPLREFLATQSTIEQIVDFGYLPVFEGATTYPAIYLTKNGGTQEQHFVYAPIKRLSFTSLDEEVEATGINLDNRALAEENWALAGVEEIAIFEKMRNVGTPLGEIEGMRMYRGVLTGLNAAFVIDEKTRDSLIEQDPNSAELIKPFVLGDDVRKYHIRDKGRYLILIQKGWTLQNSPDIRDKWGWFTANYPAIAAHLAPFANRAQKRYDKGDFWWELRTCEYYEAFEEPKIVYPDIAKESRFTIDYDANYTANTTYIIPTANNYALGVLNSKLIFTYFKRISSVLGDAEKGGRLRWILQDIVKLPIRTIDFSDPSDVEMHGRMVQMVEQMLQLNKRLATATLGQEITILKRQIEATDRRIDELVYELYGLNEEEIALVEDSAG